MIVVKKKENNDGSHRHLSSPIKPRKKPQKSCFGGNAFDGYGNTSYQPSVLLKHRVTSSGGGVWAEFKIRPTTIQQSPTIVDGVNLYGGKRKKGVAGGAWGDHHGNDDDDDDDDDDDMFGGMNIAGSGDDDDEDDNDDAERFTLMNQTQTIVDGGNGDYDLLGDIFGDIARVSQDINKQNKINNDILSDIIDNLPCNNNNINDNSDSLPCTKTGFAALRAELGTNIMGFPRSHETDKILFKDSQFEISYFTIYKPQKSTLCIFISNLTATNLSSVLVSVKKDNARCPLQFEWDISSCVPKPGLTNATTAIIPQLNGHDTTCQMITFGATNPAQISMPCNIILAVNNKILQIGLKMSDLVRASMIHTQDFGANWAKLSKASCLFNINVSNASTTYYIQTITERLHLHHVQTIKNESIAAGNLSSITNYNMLLPILIHCKCLENKSYSIIVRTPYWNISTLIGNELEQLLLS